MRPAHRILQRPVPGEAVAPEANDPPADKPAEAPDTVASEQVKRAREVIEAIRKRADLSAKALAAIGGGALGAISLDKVGDLSPTDWDGSTVMWAILLLVGFVFMAAAIVAFVIRLEAVNRPVVMSSRLNRLDLEGAEQALVAQAFADMADLNDAPSLRAYEARAARLDRIADRSDEARAPDLRRRAARIRAEVKATHARAASDVVRARGAKALTGKDAIRWYAAAVLGFVVFTIGVDHLESERQTVKESIAHDSRVVAVRKERVAVAKECAATHKAYADQDLTVTLPKDARCPEFEPVKDTGGDTEAKAPSGTATAAAGALTDLATRYASCQAAVQVTDDTRDAADEARCSRILAAVESFAATQR